LDIGVLHTSEEVILDTKKANMSEIVLVGMAITHASLDKAIAKERELEVAKKEVASLSTPGTILLRGWRGF
jgi:hypothetical protein